MEEEEKQTTITGDIFEKLHQILKEIISLVNIRNGKRKIIVFKNIVVATSKPNAGLYHKYY